MPLEQPAHPTSKHARLLALARLRQATRWLGYTSIADYHEGAYECDHVSPYTKSAGNVDAAVMVILQDWAADGDLSGALDHEAKRLGYTPGWQTNRNLAELLKATFGFSLSDIFATNLFPFVKPGHASSAIPERDMVRAAREFALPQIEIVEPKLVVCLGLSTFNALRIAHGLARANSMTAAIDSPFAVGVSQVWCQGHTGAFGQMNRKRAGVDPLQDWLRMRATSA